VPMCNTEKNSNIFKSFFSNRSELQTVILPTN